jgi:hypothetical protein
MCMRCAMIIYRRKEGMNMEVKKTLGQMSMIFRVFGGVALLIVLFFVIRLLWIVSTITPVEGVITQIIVDQDDDDTRILTVRYEIDSVIYFGNIEVYSNRFVIGDPIMVYPKPASQGELYRTQTHIFLIIPGLFSLIFLSVGISINPSMIKEERKLERLRQLGKKERAIIIKIDHQRWMSVSSFNVTYHPIVIVCKKKDSSTGIEYIYKTKRLWGFDDTGIVPNESTVIVWINPRNQKQYMIDLDTIKNVKDDPFE